MNNGFKKAFCIVEILSALGMPLAKGANLGAQEKPLTAQEQAFANLLIRNELTRRARDELVAQAIEHGFPNEYDEEQIADELDILMDELYSCVDRFVNLPKYQGVDIADIINDAKVYVYNSFLARQLNQATITR